MSLRSFGLAESDLAVDFGARNRAALVTRVLAACTADPVGRSEAFQRDLSAGKRLESLVTLAAGGPEGALTLACKCGGCGEDLELELTVQELSALQREADTIETVAVDLGGRRLEFRKPRGRDQEAWGELEFHDEEEAVAAMIGTLAVDPLGRVGPEWFPAIETALDQADPLVDFTCSIRCDVCGRPNEYSLDLMDIALGLLRRAQHQLVVTLHRLASHYHWTEQEIFAIPAWRRQQYLDLIAASGQ